MNVFILSRGISYDKLEYLQYLVPARQAKRKCSVVGFQRWGSLIIISYV